MIFGKPANYCNLGKQSRLTIFFSLLLPVHSPSPLRVSRRTFIVKLTGESFRFRIFLKFNTILLLCVSVADFFNRNLFDSLTTKFSK